VALADFTSRDAALAATREFESLGRDEFLRRYGFGRSGDYELVHDGERYDPKAIVGAGAGHQHPKLGPLSSDDFSDGRSTINELRQNGSCCLATVAEGLVDPRGVMVRTDREQLVDLG
jgi:hypothetical protein